MNLQTYLPPYEGKRRTVQEKHTIRGIVNEVCSAHKEFANEYDRIAKFFWRGNVIDTLKYLFNWCHENLTYKVEPETMQTTRSPAAILNTARSWGVDCKHYAGWIGGVLDALKRQGANIKWWYRFVSYDMTDSTPEHVFIVVEVDGREVFVDPVMKTFDSRFPIYFYKLDKNCSMLQRISGNRISAITENKIVTLPGFVPGVEFNSLIQASDGTKVTAADEPKETNWLLWLGIGAAVYYFAKNKRR